MNDTTGLGQGLSDLSQIVGKLIDIQRGFGEELLKVVGGGSNNLGGLLQSTLGSLTRATTCTTSLSRSCCDIPEPCWMPKSLGEITCVVCPGASATIRVRVTNEDIRPRPVVAVASGSAAKDIQFAPPELHLGPKERASLTAVLAVPATASAGQELEAIIWIRGCRDYYLRWTVTVGNRAGCCAHDVDICDGPDNILHWYDHFYCPRPCRGGRAG